MENQITDPQTLSQSQGIPGMTTSDTTPIAPPEGYEDAPQENILERVRAAMDKFNQDMALMAQGGDPHPPVATTVEEVDSILRDVNGLLTIQPNNDLAKEMQNNLLNMRQRIINEQAEAQTRAAQAAQAAAQAGVVPPTQQPVEEPNPQVLSQEQVQQVHQEETAEMDQSIAALQEDDNPFSMATSSQSFDATQAQFTAAEPPAQEIQAQPAQQPVQQPTTMTPTTQPVEEEMSTIMEDNDDNGKVVITRRQVHRADMPTAPDGRRINATFNKTLEYFVRGYFKHGEIDDDLTINGATISNSSNVGVFEEGGANQNEGTVLLATDENGYRLPALMTYIHQEAVNGKQALITIYKNNYVLLGGQKDGKSILGIYKIVDTAIKKDKKGKGISELNGELICYASKGTEIAFTEQADAHDKGIWHTKHPAIIAAFGRMYERNADRPAYIQDYRDCYCDTDDLVKLMSNQNIIASLQSYNNLDEAYAAIGGILAAEVAKCLNTDDLPTLSVILNSLPEYNAVAVYLIGALYDKAKKTSHDRCVVYGRVILYPGSEMYYPDKVDDPNMRVPYTTLVERLSRTGGKMVSSLRRVTK